jgi:hypothetical protein
MPNVEDVGEDWAKFRTSVKEIEELTGFTFFDKVPANIIEPLKETPPLNVRSSIGRSAVGNGSHWYSSPPAEHINDLCGPQGPPVHYCVKGKGVTVDGNGGSATTADTSCVTQISNNRRLAIVAGPFVLTNKL